MAEQWRRGLPAESCVCDVRCMGVEYLGVHVHPPAQQRPGYVPSVRIEGGGALKRAWRLWAIPDACEWRPIEVPEGVS